MATVLHSTLTTTELHEPKGASTATSGQVYVADGAGSGTWTTSNDASFTGIGSRAVLIGDGADGFTSTTAWGDPNGVASGYVYTANGSNSGAWEQVHGWGQYQDSRTTVGTPTQTLATGVSQTMLCDGAALTVERLPSDAIAPVWNVTTNKHVPIAEFDTYDMRVSFTAENYSGATPYLQVDLDIGAPIGVIVSKTFPLLKAGSAQDFIFSFPVFTGATYMANGGFITLTYTGTGTCDVYKTAVMLTRTSRDL